jgi:guanylate kinase
MWSETMEAESIMKSGVLLLISAPSGGGKTTVCASMLTGNPALKRVITCTTRAPRPGEVNGHDYHFLAMPEFEQRMAAGEFLEQALVYGNRYGTLRSSVLDVLRSGADVLLNIDVQGAASIRKVAMEDPEIRSALATVFLTPRTLAELESRLRGRGSESEDIVARRLSAAPAEVAEAVHFDYLIVSETRESDLRRVQSIYEAEKTRRHRVDLGGWRHA